MILIVDDRQENIFALKSVLEQHGFRTAAALSGEEALKMMLKEDYALIILDVQMPGMDGFEVAEAITSFNKTKDIPVIFLSAVSTHKKFVTKGFETGAVDYLTKPVDPEILILKVRNFYRLYEKTKALKEAEKALSNTVNELHSTLESLPQLAFTTDRHGKLEFVNRQWFEFAVSKDDFPKTAAGKASVRELLQQCIRKERAGEIEVLLEKLDGGHHFYHLLKVVPVKAHTDIIKWVGTFTNIHDQKMINETLEQKVAERTKELLSLNRDLEISNSDLQQFTSVASHDLKEPLRKIIIFGKLLKEKLSLDQASATHLNKILQASARMDNLISDLLSFSKLSQQIPFQRTDINEVIASILDDLELTIEQKNASIEVEKIPEIEAIPALIRQLFQNLISNSLKFSKSGVPPRIKIEASRVAMPDLDSLATEDGRFCRISISDNGIGLDQKFSKKIFTIFQRLNTRTEYEGTGIGLAIAKKIVDRHHGLIEVRSNVNEGATFFVILPVQQEQQLREIESYISTTEQN